MANEKISAMPTLANPPTAAVFDAVITNDGTTQTNFQRPQGQIVQPAGSGLGVLLRGAVSTNSSPAGAAFTTGGNAYNTGTGEAIGGYAGQFGGNATISGAGVSARAGAAYLYAGAAHPSGTLASTIGAAFGGYIYGFGAYINASSPASRGGDLKVGGGAGGSGGNLTLSSGGAVAVGGTSGNVIITPATGGATNGVLLVANIGTVDPHILNAKWQKSVAGVGYVGVYSKG